MPNSQRTDSPALQLEEVTAQLLTYCRAHDWAGHDPYDALNSKVFAAMPFSHRPLPRLLFTQLLKRSPTNFRRLLNIPHTQNPKALALFLMALLKLRRLGDQLDPEILYLANRLRELRSPDHRYWTWGYSFAWQGRQTFAPRNEANLVCTTFVANAFLDAYEASGQREHLEIATSAGYYLLRELFWTDDSTASFSYPQPSTRSIVHNANLLAGALLLRIYERTEDVELFQAAMAAARFSVSRQQADGSWFYGELPSQRWIDNFHTGYNLRSLLEIKRLTDTDEFDRTIDLGFQFYRKHFFRSDGAPRYFHDRTYPIDIHCVAESLITLCRFADKDTSGLDQANHVYRWAMANLWDRRGFFYYQRRRLGVVKTSYMRWAQAWMLLALATLLEGRRQSFSENASSVSHA